MWVTPYFGKVHFNLGLDRISVLSQLSSLERSNLSSTSAASTLDRSASRSSRTSGSLDRMLSGEERFSSLSCHPTPTLRHRQEHSKKIDQKIAYLAVIQFVLPNKRFLLNIFNFFVIIILQLSNFDCQIMISKFRVKYTTIKMTSIIILQILSFTIRPSSHGPNYCLLRKTTWSLHMTPFFINVKDCKKILKMGNGKVFYHLSGADFKLHLTYL